MYGHCMVLEWFCTVIARHCTLLHGICTALHATARSLHGTARYCTVFARHCTLLHGTARYCTALHGAACCLHAPCLSLVFLSYTTLHMILSYLNYFIRSPILCFIKKLYFSPLVSEPIVSLVTWLVVCLIGDSLSCRSEIKYTFFQFTTINQKWFWLVLFFIIFYFKVPSCI